MSCYQNIIYGPKATSKFENETLGSIYYKALTEGNPSDIVVVDANTKTEISRQTLLTTSVNLAKILQNYGILAGDVLGIVSVNTWKFLVAVLSAAYIGASVTLSNPNYLEDDIRGFLKAASPKVLFLCQMATEKFRPILKDFPCVKKVISYGEILDNGELSFSELLKQEQEVEDFKPIDVDIAKSVAWIPFSSGTTGIPKGIIISQKAFISALINILDKQSVALTYDSTVICVMPLFHIYGVALSMSTLTVKGKMILVEKFQPTSFLKAIEEYKVNFLPLVPQLIQFLSRSPLVEQYDISSVKEVIFGAAPSDNHDAELLRKRLNITVRQLYGMTETSGLISICPNEAPSGSVGKLIVDSQAKIIDIETKEIIDPHTPGEICIKGPNIMSGYINNEGQSTNNIDEDGFLHTGDMGYFDEDGFLFIVDRLKEIIKYKGFQVSPVQLELIIQRYPGVKEVGVIGKPDERAGELPMAVVVLESGINVTEKEIIDFVAESVHAEKQLHGGVVFVDELPKTKLGKIKRRDLKYLVFQ